MSLFGKFRLGRTNQSVLGAWWWTVDRWTLAAVLFLSMLGLVLSLAASPAVASKIGLPSFHFVYRQAIFLVPALFVLLGVSMLSVRQVRRLAILGFAGVYVLMLATLAVGPEIKGATRWLSMAGFSLQPSEFIKPLLVILLAWMFSEAAKKTGVPGRSIALGLYAMVAVVLVQQPDFGQLTLITIVFAAIFFLAGLSWFWIAGMAGLAIAGGYSAYRMVPHVTSRVDRFLDPASGDTYQIERALEAFRAGGLFGRGPGEGVVKRVLPDAHTDFIFAVAAEEYGVIVGLLILGLFGFIVIRTLLRVQEEHDLFVQLAASGLIVLIGIQALINIAVNVNLLPAKGMTLPFISYGGSSLIAVALALGMLLALTRRRAGGALHHGTYTKRAYA